MTIGKKDQVSLDNLVFDTENPRFVTGDSFSSSEDATIITKLHEISDLNELIFSISSNGYLDVEPLIVMPSKNGKYIVLEGNRRLATLKLLNNPELQKLCNISVPKAMESSQQIEKISVIIVEKKVDAASYIAFKHVNGAFRWDSFAKARFMTDWYIREKDKGVTIDDIALKIGDSHQTVRSFVSAMLLLNQAEDEKLFLIKDREKAGRFGFSHLYTALGRKEYMQFLNLDADWDESPEIVPLQNETQKKNLTEMLTYIYGSKALGLSSVVASQNPHLGQLGKALVHPTARIVLSQNRNLKEALLETEDASSVFQESCRECFGKLQNLQKILHKYQQGDSTSQYLVSEIYKMANAINSIVQK